MNENNIKISVIIPVYNVEKYLRKCLNYLVNQTLKDIEIICINDGSTDSSLNILNEYAKNDSRFIIISEKNQGQGVARNRGIKIACGKYIVFVDPDDWIELNALEILYSKFKETNADVIHFDYEDYNEIFHKTRLRSFYKHALKKLKYNLKKNSYYSWHNFRDNCLSDITLMVWNRAYSTKFIKENNIKFAESRCGEDHIFTLACLLSAQKIYYLNKYLYHYRCRQDSSVNRVVADNVCVFNNIKVLKEFLIKKNLYKELEKAFRKYIFTALSYQYACISEEGIQNYLNQCSEILSDNEYKKFLKNIKGNFSFFENIFSVKNVKYNGIKKKMIRILGINFAI